MNEISQVNSGGVISTMVGTGSAGYSGDGGAGTLATLNYPFGVAVSSSGDIYVSDTSNNVIRKVGRDYAAAVATLIICLARYHLQESSTRLSGLHRPWYGAMSTAETGAQQQQCYCTLPMA